MKKLIIPCIILFMLVSACKLPSQYIVSLMNNSDHDIAWYLGVDYPYISLPETDILLSRWSKKMNTGASHLIFDLYRHSEEEVIHALNSHDTVSVFIFHGDTLDRYTWETIKDDYKIIVRYDLSAKDIRKMGRRTTNDGYIIPFPPDERMKDIHMWPPYEEVVAKYGSEAE